MLEINTAALMAYFEQERNAAMQEALFSEAARQAEREAQHHAALEKRKQLAATVPKRHAAPSWVPVTMTNRPTADVLLYIHETAGAPDLTTAMRHRLRYERGQQ